jgi:hypothetical protein
VASLANRRCGSLRTGLHGNHPTRSRRYSRARARQSARGLISRCNLGLPAVPVDQTVRSRLVIHFERRFLNLEDRYAESGEAQAQKAPFDYTAYAWQLWRRLTVPSLIPFPFLIQQARWRRSDAQRFPNHLLELISLPGMPFPISLGIPAVTLLIEAPSGKPRTTYGKYGLYSKPRPE